MEVNLLAETYYEKDLHADFPVKQDKELLRHKPADLTVKQAALALQASRPHS